MTRFLMTLVAMILLGTVCTAHGQPVNPTGMDLLQELRQPATPMMGMKHPDDPAAAIGGLPPRSDSLQKPMDPVRQESLGSELLTAISNDDVVEAERLIVQGAPVNARLPKTGMPPIFSVRSPGMLRLLLKFGADPDAADDFGRTALHHMLFEKDAEELLGILLRHGADVNRVATLSDGETPLLAARELFFEGRDQARAEAVMALLLRAGADVNAQDDSGYTLLMTAAVNDKPRLARLALDHGADPSLTCNDGKTPLLRAQEFGHTEIATMISQASAQTRP